MFGLMRAVALAAAIAQPDCAILDQHTDTTPTTVHATPIPAMPLREEDRLRPSSLSRYRAYAHLSEQEGLAQLRTYATLGMEEDIWAFDPSTKEWFDIGYESTKENVTIDTRMFQRLLQERSGLNGAHYHPSRRVGGMMVLSDREALPSSNDVNNLIVSSVIAARQHTEPYRDVVVSQKGVAKAMLTPLGLACFSTRINKASGYALALDGLLSPSGTIKENLERLNASAYLKVTFTPWP